MSLQSLACYTENLFSIPAIKSLELIILRLLNWKILPPTPYSLLACIMKEWDLYLIQEFSALPNNSTSAFEALDKGPRDLHINAYNSRMITLMQNNCKSYQRYQAVLQVLDLVTLDFSMNKFSIVYIVAGILYAMLSKFFEQTGYSLFKWNGELDRSITDELFDYREHCGNIVFHFLANTLQISLEALEMPLRFLNNYIEIQGVIDRLDFNNTTVSDMQANYSELLPYQTYSSNALSYLRYL